MNWKILEFHLGTIELIRQLVHGYGNVGEQDIGAIKENKDWDWTSRVEAGKGTRIIRYDRRERHTPILAVDLAVKRWDEGGVDGALPSH
jgi:hypothetical protein